MTMRGGAARWLFGFAAVGVLLAGCASDPYWSAADRAAAERRDAADRAARAAAVPEPPPSAIPDATEVEAPQTLAAEPAPGVESASGSPSAEPGAPPPTAIDSSDLEETELTEASPAGAGEAFEADPMQTVYDAALDLLQRGEGVAAERAFRDFLARYGSSDLADNAQYWLAESLRRRGENEDALAAFRLVVEGYPAGNKVPDALFKIGQILEQQGETELADEVYDELTDRFPGSAAAETARARRVARPQP